MNLAEGGPNFASFAKSGDKIANLATLRGIGLELCHWLQLALPGWRSVSLPFLIHVSLTSPVELIPVMTIW